MSKEKQTEEVYKPITGEELKLLYTAVLTDIQFIKKQQVEITNYVVGGFVAIVLFFNMVVERIEFIPYLRFILGSFLGLVSLIIMVLGICLIYRLEWDLEESQNLKRRTIERFTNEFKDILKIKEISSVFGFFVAAQQ